MHARTHKQRQTAQDVPKQGIDSVKAEGHATGLVGLGLCFPVDPLEPQRIGLAQHSLRAHSNSQQHQWAHDKHQGRLALCDGSYLHIQLRKTGQDGGVQRVGILWSGKGKRHSTTRHSTTYTTAPRVSGVRGEDVPQGATRVQALLHTPLSPRTFFGKCCDGGVTLARITCQYV